MPKKKSTIEEASGEDVKKKAPKKKAAAKKKSTSKKSTAAPAKKKTASKKASKAPAKKAASKKKAESDAEEVKATPKKKATSKKTSKKATAKDDAAEVKAPAKKKTTSKKTASKKAVEEAPAKKTSKKTASRKTSKASKKASKASKTSKKPAASMFDELISLEGLGPLLCVAWAPSGEMLAVAGNSGVISLVDAKTGEVVRRLKGHKETVFGLVFCEEGTQLVSMGADTTVRVWEVETGTFLEDLSGILSMTPRMRTLRGQLMQGSTAGHTQPALCGDWEPGTKVLATGGQDFLVKAWREGRALRTFDWHTGDVTAVRFRPDHPELILSSSRDATLRLWSVSTGAMKARYEGHIDQVMAAAWVDASTFVSGDISGALLSWDAEAETVRRRLIKEGTPIRALDVTADGKKILVGFESGDLACYTLKKGRETARVEAHALAIRATALDPVGGNRLASVGVDGALRIWEIA